MPVFLDKPDREITDPRIDVYGWVAAPETAPAIRVTANGRPVRHLLYGRPDVRRSLPGFGFVAGVYAPLLIFDLDPCETIEIALAAGPDMAELRCILPPTIQQARAAEETLRLAARDKCFAVLACPSCRSDVIRAQSSAALIVCADCGATYSQATRAINMVADQPDGRAEVTAADNIALPPEAEAARALIRRVTGVGGWVLDVGAGRRSWRTRHVVTVGALDHAWVDVLAVAEALPFADGSFDAVISLGILDRVADPQAGARELLRVVKPGGEILAGVPALRPVTPPEGLICDLTQQGLASLFADGADLMGLTPPEGGAPVRALQALLRDALAALPESLRDTVSAMTVGDLALIDPGSMQEYPPSVSSGLPDASLALVRAFRRR